MADHRPLPPSVAAPAPAVSAACPLVAELISYGLGEASPEERRRVEDHLRSDNCDACRRWTDRAATLRDDPWPQQKRKKSATAGPDPHRRAAAVEQLTEQTAFSNLSERLRRLEEN